ncbi:MAG: hypothetical protein K1Y36_20090 [Blastocatellia bacterium]|nr:hypothetical protein [Blastocatellia bacterium]
MKTNSVLSPQSSVLNPFTVADRLVQFTDGNGKTVQAELGELTDFGFLEISPSGNLLGRSFVTPDGMLLVADLKSFPGTVETAFERLWHAHFRRNFKRVGMGLAQWNELHSMGETVFQRCLEQLPAPGRKFQQGYLEPTAAGFRPILPRGVNPSLPELALTGLNETEISQGLACLPVLIESRTLFLHEGLVDLLSQEPAGQGTTRRFLKVMAGMAALSPIRLTM